MHIKHINFRTIAFFITLAIFTIPNILFAAGRKTIKDARGTNGPDGKRIPDIEQNVTVSGIATLNDGIVLTHKVFDYSSFYFMETYADGTTAGLNAYQGPEKGPAIGTWDKGTTDISDDIPRYVTEGDSITINGKIMQFNGNMEVSADPNFNIVIHSTGNALPIPIIVTCKQAGAKSTGNDGGEIYEGKLIKIKNVNILASSTAQLLLPPWSLMPPQSSPHGGGIECLINDGTGDMQMFIHNMTDIVRNNINLPSSNMLLEITGIVGQYGTIGGDGWLTTYILLVRSFNDIKITGTLPGIGTLQGKITKSDGITPVTGTRIEFLQNGVLFNQAFTNSSGIYLFSLSSGTYDLRASSTGYQTLTKPNIQVIADSVVTVNFVLFGLTEQKPQPEYKTTIGDNVFKPGSGNSAKIGFSVPASGKVTIKIYDLMGRLVCTLVDQNYNPGNFEKDWSGKDDSGETVAPGVYLLHYQYPGGQETRKIGVKK